MRNFHDWGIMHEFTVPVIAERSDLQSVSALLEHRVRLDPHHVAFARRIEDRLVDITGGEFRDQVRKVAKGLITSGVELGDSVAIMSPTRYEWAVAEFAIWEVGGVVVPIYETASIGQVEAILQECAVKVAFAGTRAHGDVLEAASPGIGAWTFDRHPDRDLDSLTSASRIGSVRDEEIDRRGDLVNLDSLASIVFTSGTTGRQRGVRITHGNFVRLVVQVAQAYEDVVNDRARTIILLPLAHVLAQGLQLASVYAGMKVVHESDPRSAIAIMGEVKPTFMVVVPRILDRIQAVARNSAEARHLGRVFFWAQRTAIAWGEYLERSQDDPQLKAPRHLRLLHDLFDRLFYSRLRALMGGEVGYLLSGASRLDPALNNFYRGIGIPVVEGYGLTETTAPITGNRPGHMRAGSVGIPIPGSTVRILDTGEVAVRGVGVTPGYLRADDNVDAYADGFYRTGDIGRLDEDGFLYIQGRLKNILVTSSGKNVAPEPWEQAVERDPLVAHAIMVGEDRPYVAALVVLNAEETISWAKRHGESELAGLIERASTGRGAEGYRIEDSGVLEAIGKTIGKANAAVSRAEQVRTYAVLISELTEADQTLTPTLKLRRDEFLKANSRHVQELYT